MATQTCTVVFTDLANYTASVGRSDREGIRNLVAAHERMVMPTLEQHNGRVLKNIGDSFMATFASATDAVRAGLDLVERISGEAGFHIRVAMATGDVELITGDAFGEVVNLSSRILAKAPPGQVWLSQATLLCMNQAEIAWEPVGRFALKGIAGEAEVFRAVPRSRTWLPESVIQAVRSGRLVRFQRGSPPPRLPPQPIILLEGFPPGSPLLDDAVASLPVIDPASLWLVAHTIAPSDRIAWQRSGRGLVISTPEALNVALGETQRRLVTTTGSDTLLLDSQGSSFAELVLAGLALLAVPLIEVVAGYTYDLLADGRWVNNSDHAIARVDVSPERVALIPLISGLGIGGRQLQPGSPIILSDGDTLSTPSGPLVFRTPESAVYAGILLGDSNIRMGIAVGQTAEIGREPNHPGLALPDRRGQDNVRWCPGFRAARARDGGFTMDRALAGRRQAAIHLAADTIQVVSLHERCITYVLRGDRLEPVLGLQTIAIGDLIITGTSVVALREPG